MIKSGKGARDRVVYISHDAAVTLAKYLQIRLITTERKVFLVEKGKFRGKPISVRGIQKRIEYYSRKSSVPASCHQLRHTMATQLLNADADLVSIQEILGHTRIKTNNSALQQTLKPESSERLPPCNGKSHGRSVTTMDSY